MVQFNNIILYINFIFIKIILSQINDNFNYSILENNLSPKTRILDIADYLNLSLIVSASGAIYNGNIFLDTQRAITYADLNASSAIAICNNNYMLAACLNDYLLVKINFNNGSFEPLVEYSEFNDIIVSYSSSCCVSIYENIVFIAISQPSNDKIKNRIIRLNILNKDDLDNGPIIDNSAIKKSFIFPVEYAKTSTTRDVSCEVALEKTTNDYRLICAYEDKGGMPKIIYLSSINFDLEDFEKTIIINRMGYEFGFRLYKLDNYYLRLVLRSGVYDINLNSNFDIISKNLNSNFKEYNSYWNLFAYHNNVIITYLTNNCINSNAVTVSCSDMRIITPDNQDYYEIFAFPIDNSAKYIKMYNYYNYTLDYLII